jgi:hypothetical protein
MQEGRKESKRRRNKIAIRSAPTNIEGRRGKHNKREWKKQMNGIKKRGRERERERENTEK